MKVNKQIIPHSFFFCLFTCSFAKENFYRNTNQYYSTMVEIFLWFPWNILKSFTDMFCFMTSLSLCQLTYSRIHFGSVRFIVLSLGMEDTKGCRNAGISDIGIRYVVILCLECLTVAVIQLSIDSRKQSDKRLLDVILESCFVQNYACILKVSQQDPRSHH